MGNYSMKNEYDENSIIDYMMIDCKKMASSLSKDKLKMSESLMKTSVNRVRNLYKIVEEGKDHKLYEEGFRDGILQARLILELLSDNRN